MVTIAGLLVMVAATGATSVQQHEVRSPDGRTRVIVQAGETLTWSVEHAGTLLLEPSPISMRLAAGGGLVARLSPLEAR